MAKPPFFVLIAVATPAGTVELLGGSGKGWIVEPVFATAGDGSGIAPVVIRLGVGGVVDIAAAGLPRGIFIQSGKSVPGYSRVSDLSPIYLPHGSLHPVS